MFYFTYFIKHFCPLHLNFRGIVPSYPPKSLPREILCFDLVTAHAPKLKLHNKSNCVVGEKGELLHFGIRVDDVCDQHGVKFGTLMHNQQTADYRELKPIVCLQKSSLCILILYTQQQCYVC